MRRTAVALVLLASLAGCDPAPAAPAPAATPTGPSAAARMVCEAEAQEDIAEVMGLQVTAPVTPVWADGLLSCRYAYPAGFMVISVKDLPDAAATDAYYARLQAATVGQEPLIGVGQQAFAAPTGAVFVRKDNKVLLVDVAGLPASYGSPAQPRKDIAFTVASVILHCWVEQSG